MSIVRDRKPRASLADLLAIPEERRRHELIDGELHEKPVASGRHGGAQVKVGARLDPYNRRVGRGGPGGWWFATEATIQFDETQVYRPDVAGWRRERLVVLPAEPVVTVVPDWICEILSPSNASHDTVRKKRCYHRHRVGHYWVIDPMSETLSVYRHTADGYLEVATAATGERIRAEPFGEVELSIGELFGVEDDDPAE